MRNFLRLLTGRVAYERRAAILAAELATRNGMFDEYQAQQIFAFLYGAYP